MEICICIIVLLVPLFIYVLYKYLNEKSLKKKIAWCVIKDRQYRIYNCLSDYIHIEQRSLENKYHLCENDKNIIDEILQIYQQKLIEDYFKGYTRNYHNLTEQSYFFTTLNDFLGKHRYDTFFNNKELVINKNKLTTYGIVFHKLYYITQMYCINLYEYTHKKKLSIDSIAYRNANYTKEMIDKGVDNSWANLQELQQEST